MMTSPQYRTLRARERSRAMALADGQARQVGRMDAYLGRSLNPYRRDSQDAAEWLEGYTEIRLQQLDAEARDHGWPTGGRI